MTRLFLLFHGRFPSEKAASLFAAKSAESFADEGVDVTLIVPRRIGRKKENAYEFYGVKSNFKITYVPIIDIFFIPLLSKLAFFVSFLSFSFFSLVFIIFKAKKDDIIYSNEWMPIFFATFLFPRTFYELHDFPESAYWFYIKFFSRVKYILAHNKWKKDKLETDFSVSSKKIISIPNAVDIKKFDATPIIESMAKMSFTSRDLANAAEIFDQMIRDKDCTVILTLAGSTSAGTIYCWSRSWRRGADPRGIRF